MYKASFIFLIFIIFSNANAQLDSLALNYEQAKKLAELPLHCVTVEYPNKLNQVLTDSSFINSPKNLHPIFYGCFDWHSSVHGYWLLATVTTRFDVFSDEILSLFNQQFTKENVAAELAYFEPKLEKSFERTYGWAWILKLHVALMSSGIDHDGKLDEIFSPLSKFIRDSYMEFLPKLVYPIRVGEHTNTAFGLSLALDYARATADTAFEKLIVQRSKDYFLEDKNCPLSWEPSGFDFISPCLEEAELMSKILEQKEFEKWISEFLPQIFKKNFTLEPGIVLDRTDGKLVHLDGLNFSRARCFYSLAKVLPKYSSKFIALGDDHINASMKYVVGSDYMGSHWLASFLVYALEAREKVLK